ncbi:MAG TPA: AI-2E family transporter [Blastocatellia bacterium]|jgi:predicted PurR-regulated permease PerM|nr:AI-2E family transporter [Blastocatellia bacterium]
MIVKERKRKIYIRWLALLALTAAALYVCWLMLLPFVNVLAWASVLVILFYPIHQRLVALTKRPGWSALLSTVIVIAVIVLPLTLLTLVVAKEIGDVAKNAQEFLRSLLDTSSPVIGWITGRLGRYVDASHLDLQGYLLERLKNISGAIAGRTLGLLGGVVGVIFQMFFTVFTMYYLFRDGDRIYEAMLEAIPLNAAETRKIFDRTHEVIHASVYGVIVIAMVQGTLGGLAFAALGLPSPVVWGVVMFFLSMVPMVGSSVIWVPTAIYLGMSGHWGKALALALWGALVIGTIDNFLRPKLVGERARLHELLIFFSVLGGLQIWGPLGLVLGPVMIAITLALFDVFRHMDPSFKAAPPPIVEHH